MSTDAEVIDLASVIRPGDRVLVGSGAAEPLALTRQLVEQRHQLRGVQVLLGYTVASTVLPEHTDELEVTVLGGYGKNSQLTHAGAVDVLPCRLGELPDLIADGILRVDVVLLCCSPADERGTHSLGVTADVLAEAATRARVVVAEVNDQMPRTSGDTSLPSAQVTAQVRTSRPLPELERATPGPVERTVAEHVADLVADRSVLQLGIGRVPEAVARRLTGHRDLGIHSGFLGDWALDLIEAGAVTNAYKPIDRGVTVGGVLMGSQRLYSWAHSNPSLSMRNARHTHGARALGRFESFVAVNSAIEVDLTGQVNAELVGDRYVGAVGGQVDFVRAGAASPRGMSVIALPATTTRGGGSRIVHRLARAVVTTPRADIDVVVTEHGVAHMRGQTLAERTRRMIAIAAPDCRDELAMASAEPW